MGARRAMPARPCEHGFCIAPIAPREGPVVAMACETRAREILASL